MLSNLKVTCVENENHDTQSCDIITLLLSNNFDESRTETKVVNDVNNVYVPFRVGGVFPWLVKINNIHNIQLLLIKLVVHYIGHY